MKKFILLYFIYISIATYVIANITRYTKTNIYTEDGMAAEFIAMLFFYFLGFILTCLAYKFFSKFKNKIYTFLISAIFNQCSFLFFWIEEFNFKEFFNQLVSSFLFAAFLNYLIFIFIYFKESKNKYLSNFFNK